MLCPYEKGKFGHGDRARLELRCHKTRNAQNCEQTTRSRGKVRNRLPLRALDFELLASRTVSSTLLCISPKKQSGTATKDWSPSTEERKTMLLTFFPSKTIWEFSFLTFYPHSDFLFLYYVAPLAGTNEWYFRKGFSLFVLHGPSLLILADTNPLSGSTVFTVF